MHGLIVRQERVRSNNRSVAIRQVALLSTGKLNQQFRDALGYRCEVGGTFLGRCR